jgi:hypothetical protein
METDAVLSIQRSIQALLGLGHCFFAIPLQVTFAFSQEFGADRMKVAGK